MDNTEVGTFHFFDCSSVSVNYEDSPEIQKESDSVILDPLRVEEMNEDGTVQVVDEDCFVDFPIDIEEDFAFKKIYEAKLEPLPDTEPQPSSSASTVNTIPSQESVVHVGSGDKNNKPSAVSDLECEDLRPPECETSHNRFNYNSNVLVHEHTYTREKPYVCKTCRKSFTTHSSLVKHKHIHSGEKPFVCKTCGKCFSYNCYLVRHELIHSREKPFVCKTCGKSFAKNIHLAIHLSIHTQENFHVCKTCGKWFVTNGQLVMHERIHTGEKPFVCKTCGKSFARNFSLVMHERMYARENSLVVPLGNPLL